MKTLLSILFITCLGLSFSHATLEEEFDPFKKSPPSLLIPLMKKTYSQETPTLKYKEAVSLLKKRHLSWKTTYGRKLHTVKIFEPNKSGFFEVQGRNDEIIIRRLGDTLKRIQSLRPYNLK